MSTLNKEIVEKYLRTTTTYNVQDTYRTITQFSNDFSNIQQKIKEFAKKYEETKQIDIKFNSKDDILSIIMQFFKESTPELYGKVQSVLKDYMISKNIEMTNNQTSSGYTNKDGERININVNASQNVNGLIAIAQELCNAAIYKEVYTQEKKEEQKRNTFTQKATNMFMSTMILDYMLKQSILTPEQKEKLNMESLNEISRDLFALQVDQQIFSSILEQNPQAFDTNFENFTVEDFYRSIEKWKNNPHATEAIEQRIKDIANNGNTPRYLMGTVIAQLAGLKMKEQFVIEGKDEVITNLLNSVKNNYTINQLTGVDNVELVTSGTTIIDRMNEQDNAHENEDVMVMELKKRN